MNFKGANNLITVAIIDDDAFYSKIMAMQLKRAGIAIVLAADNGLLGITQLQAMSTHPQIVIVDIEMPVMNGFEVVRYLKQAWPYLQIIAHSSLTNSDVHKQIIKDGADTFVQKQPDATKLIDTIKNLSSSCGHML
ncbi:hypothetical protein CKK33_11020 [Mucilaginibacter sp. MD40]|uniref:response regulator n=1 Tax=Mucilaginibacter sp. MD40 TaxID=2029590 RepID=UPI000BAC6A26|nr:response regulator transcription factor [Mucilaginibacter sp. MD40]PAW93996.1 hypothetical protein CKK33_11020 [Mucilaginibacter sp. MD40]